MPTAKPRHRSVDAAILCLLSRDRLRRHVLANVARRRCGVGSDHGFGPACTRDQNSQPPAVAEFRTHGRSRLHAGRSGIGQCRGSDRRPPFPRGRTAAALETDRSAAADVPRNACTVEQVETDSFASEVLDSDRPVLVDFYADWCGPCKQLAPVLDDLAADTPDVKVVKVNIDASRQLAKTYQVRSVPTLMVFKQGEMVAHHRGAANRKKVEELLAR